MRGETHLILLAVSILLLTLTGCTTSPDIQAAPPTFTLTILPSPVDSPLPSPVPTPLVRGTDILSLLPTLKDRPAENTVYYLVEQEEGESDRSEIWKASLDGTEQKMIYQKIRPRESSEYSEDRWSIQHLELSPDGQKLAFADLLGYWSKSVRRLFTEQASVWVINVDGSQPVKLIEFTAEDSQERDLMIQRLVWSPDSTRLLVHRLYNYGKPDILQVVNVATGEVAEIGPGTAGSWSPDSQFIAYARNRLNAKPDGTEGFYVTTADGQEQRRVLPWEGVTFYQLGPEWSPDGKHLLFSTVNLTGTPLGNVCTITPDGTQLQSLLSWVEYVEPQWSPDGRFISMIGGQGVSSDLYILDVRSGRTWRVVAEVGPDSVEWSADSAFLLVSREGIQGGMYYIRAEDGKQFRIPVEGWKPTW